MKKVGLLLTLTLFAASIASAGIKQICTCPLTGMKVPVLMALSADGKTIAAVGKDEQSINIFDAETGKLRITLDANNETVTNLAFSPEHTDTMLAATTVKNNALVWDINKPKAPPCVFGIKAAPTAVAFFVRSTDMMLAIANADKTIAILDINKYALVEVWPLDRVITRLAFSHSGTVFATATDSLIEVFDIKGTLIGKLDVKDRVANIGFLPSRDNFIAVATVNAAVGLWNVEIGKSYETIEVLTHNLVFASPSHQGFFFTSTTDSGNDTVQVYSSDMKEDSKCPTCHMTKDTCTCHALCPTCAMPKTTCTCHGMCSTCHATKETCTCHALCPTCHMTKETCMCHKY